MTAIKLIDSETIETRNVFNFTDGSVTVDECEVHEFYRYAPRVSPRLIIVDAFERTRQFIARSRSEIAGLSDVMRDLSSAK